MKRSNRVSCLLEWWGKNCQLSLVSKTVVAVVMPQSLSREKHKCGDGKEKLCFVRSTIQRVKKRQLGVVFRASIKSVLFG